MTTTSRERLKKQISEVQQMPKKRRFYGNRLKREIIDYVWHRQDEGESQRSIANDLGIAASLLASWLRHAKRAQERGKIPFARQSRLNVEQDTRPVLLVAHVDRIHFDDVNREAILTMLGVSERIPSRRGRFTPRDEDIVRNAEAEEE